CTGPSSMGWASPGCRAMAHGWTTNESGTSSPTCEPCPHSP
ncbi:MAG: hypothetical protein AVDCRST_MAG18-3773, partial [uncultured Thermomicrobiales bacterium]